jgi:hypothetical protein
MSPQTSAGKSPLSSGGELRESYYLAGRWQNDWLFGLLRQEYLNNNPDQQPFGGYFSLISSTVSPLRGNEYERSCAENIFCRHCVNKKHQGLSLEKYRDENGLWVIGYGHVIRDQEHFHGPVTPLEAELCCAKISGYVSAAAGKYDTSINPTAA